MHKHAKSHPLKATMPTEMHKMHHHKHHVGHHKVSAHMAAKGFEHLAAGMPAMPKHHKGY